MLSFFEVHVNGRTPPLTPVTGATDIYTPPASIGGAVSSPAGSSGGNVDSAPSALFIVATCPADLQPGQAVTAANRGSVAVADCRSPEAVIGLCTRKRSPTLAVVQTAGEVVLGLSGLSPGVDYFLEGDGALTAPPLLGVTFVQRVGMATSATSLYLALDGRVVRQADV